MTRNLKIKTNGRFNNRKGTQMDKLNELINFLDKLDDVKLRYRLNKIRDSVLVEITVPGERWEVEFMSNGEIVIEKFLSDGQMFGKEEIDILFRDFSD
ncbi:MAG: hypothetical protein WAV55_01925 [Clostridiaceae bacterium]